VLAEAAQRIPTGGDRQQGRLVVVQAPERLRRVFAVSPGVPGEPTALLVLCVDWSRLPNGAAEDPLLAGSVHVDLGAAMENVLLAAEALDLGACPVMSFHRPSMKRLLRLPSAWEPHVIVAVGHRPAKPRRRPAELHSPIYWDGYDEGQTQ
jgi:nitroreductase